MSHLTHDEQVRHVRAFVETEEKAAAAASLGIVVNTYKSRLSRIIPSGTVKAATDWLALNQTTTVERDGFSYQQAPDSEEPPEARFTRRAAAFKRKRASHEARQWMAFKMTRLEPCAILWFGDPHLDDDGCDFEALEKAVEVARLPGVYSVGIGDYQNNWIGR
ncbi:MAG: hypothetical protein AAFO72_05235, partial [Pseudomonadota bacterium]